MSSIDWVGDMLYYVMRTFLGLTAPVHFLIDVLGKHALTHIKTHYISIAIVISGIVLAIDMIFLAINGVHGRRTLRPARILWISLSYCTWAPGILNELIIYLYN